MIINILILAIIAGSLLIAIALIKSQSRPYTHQEWQNQLENDFKKFGPVPDDED
ncbi:hypothetical protein [Cellulophaga lytica]|uniref:hypothetical protein n=1 Tax=Cellulophaga lytica TaxID=979 RepID=UPI003CE58BFA